MLWIIFPSAKQDSLKENVHKERGRVSLIVCMACPMLKSWVMLHLISTSTLEIRSTFVCVYNRVPQEKVTQSLSKKDKQDFVIIKWSLLFYNGYVLLYSIIIKMYLFLYNGDKTRHVRAITFFKRRLLYLTHVHNLNLNPPLWKKFVWVKSSHLVFRSYDQT